MIASAMPTDCTGMPYSSSAVTFKLRGIGPFEADGSFELLDEPRVTADRDDPTQPLARRLGAKVRRFLFRHDLQEHPL